MPNIRQEYEVDKQQLARFIHTLFRKVGTEGNVKLSAFHETKNGPDPGVHKWVHLHRDGVDGIIKKAVELADEAANGDPPRVFCPPPAIFRKGLGATLNALQTCPALFVDCDKSPEAAQHTLEALLGEAHIVVHSGGTTAENQAKRHLYWILREPATTPEDIGKLAVAQRLAIALIDGDLTITLVHPMRWPGSWHRKGKARPCTINSFNAGAEIDLDDTLEILSKAVDEASPDVRARLNKAKANGKAANGFDAHATDHRTPQDRVDEWGDLVDNVMSGVDYHDSINRLAMKLLRTGMDDRAVRNMIQGLMERTEEEARDQRWEARYADIERAVSSAKIKVDAEMADAEAEQLDIRPVDLWGHFAPPALPRGVLPDVIERFAFNEGEQMGADPAGLAIGALVVCAAAISDDIMLRVKQHSRGWIERPILWAGLLGGPSERKSPIMNAVERPLKTIDARLMREHLTAKAAYAALSKEEKAAREESHRVRLRIEDATTEACQDAQRFNPRGMLSSQDELSGWFGAMDKYGSGGKGAGKDRGFWLQTWTGGGYLVDRCSRGVFTIPNMGLSMLGGVQDSVIRKLASDVYDDGLIQRLIPIVLRAATESKDEPASQSVEEYSKLIEQLCRLTSEAVDGNRFTEEAGGTLLKFDDAAQKIRQQVEHKHREMMQNFAGLNKRLASHIGKYDGYFARLCLVFHVIENVGAVRIAPLKNLPGTTSNNERKLPGVIGAATAENVAKFMHEFLFPHAVAFYAGVLGVADDHDRLTAVAAYVLAQGLEEITNRDVARGTRAMRQLGRRDIEAVFEQLEALGWLIRLPDKKRPSAPSRWKVNPAAHRMFAQKAKDEAARRKKIRQLIKEKVEWVRGKG
jgi:hypothetical protein